jgi:hypothetical protein
MTVTLSDSLGKTYYGSYCLFKRLKKAGGGTPASIPLVDRCPPPGWSQVMDRLIEPAVEPGGTLRPPHTISRGWCGMRNRTCARFAKLGLLMDHMLRVLQSPCGH